MDTSHSLAGQFLIAMPVMGDPHFARGVTMVCQHGEDGAIGLMVNRMSEFNLGEVLEQMQIPCLLPEINRLPVLKGGPVQTERGFVLHDGPPDWDASFRVNNTWSVTTSRDILEASAVGEGPPRVMMALGYAGWGAGQLEQELCDNAWLTSHADSRIIFDTPLEQRWHASAGLVGVDPRQLTGYAGHA